MKKIILLIVSLMFSGFVTHAQCNATSSFGTATINASGALTTISTCSFAGEYSTINGAVAGQSLRFTSSVSTDFITIRSGSSSGPVVGYGQTPLTISNTFTGTLYAHWSSDSTCGAQSSCRTTTVQCLSCTVSTGSCTFTSSFGTATINAAGGITTISTCSFAGEYSTINGAVAGQSLKFTSSVGTDFITIHSGSSSGPVVAAGISPLTFTNSFTGTLYAHWATNNACATQSTCRTTTVECVSCGLPSGPTNDNCSGAIVLNCGSSVTGNTGTATDDTGLPFCVSSTAYKGLWYKITPTSDTNITLSTCGNATWDTVLRVYGGTCGALTCLAGNDDYCGLQSQIILAASAGTTYYVLLTGFNAGSSGAFTLTATCFTPCTPSIVCPADITTSAAPDQCGANVTYAATTSNSCDATTFSYSPASGSFFPIGTTTVTATATSGSLSSSCTFTVTVNDTQAPTITCVSPLLVDQSATTEANSLTADTVGIGQSFMAGKTGTLEKVRLNFAHSGNQPIDVFIRSGNGGGGAIISSVETITNPGTFPSWKDITFSLPATVTAGSNYTVWIRETNITATGGADVIVRTLAASANYANGMLYFIGGPSNSDFVFETFVRPSNIELNTDPGQCTSSTSIGMPTATDSCNSVTVSGPVPAGPYAVGTTTVTWTATDSAGNFATCTKDVVVTDNQAPVISCVSPLLVDQSATTEANSLTADMVGIGQSFVAGKTGTLEKVRLNFAHSSNQPIDVFIRSGNGGGGAIISSVETITNPGTFPSWKDITFSLPATVTAGSNYTVWIRETNITATGGFDVIVRTLASSANYPNGMLYFIGGPSNSDFVFETFVRPSNIELNTDSGQCTASASIGAPTATDNCSVTVSGPVPAGPYAVGTTSVTWTATDSSGNFVTCTKDVVVTDNQAPVINCPSNIVVGNDPNQCGANVTFAATATDNCSATVTYNPASGSFFALGTTTVTATADDGHGNTSSCSFTVTVTDTQAPVLTCPDNIVVGNDNNQCGANVTFAATATDNCGTATITYSPTSGTYFTLGTTTVTATADDGHGNTASCTFTVTVNDTQGPSITCPAPIVVQCPGDVVLVPPTVSDNCSLGVIYGPDLTLNGSFAAGSTGWDQCGNNVEAYGTEAGYGGSNPSNSVAEIDHEPVSLCQSINGFVVGQTYQLSFRASRRSYAPSTVGANITIDGGALNTTVIRSNTTFDLTPESFTFVATQTSHQLTFVASEGWDGTVGFIVDDIAIKKVTTIDNNAPANFPYGTTTVTWSVADSSGNVSTCAQTVSVHDTLTPVINNCPNDIVVNNTPGQCNTSVSWASPTATDNCVVQSLESNYAPGADFPIGTTTVTYTATDANGNSTSCSFNVTVNIGDIYYADNDGDGYGNPNVSLVTCSQPAGYVTDNTDCNDAAFAINPGVVDTPYDNIDNNCDGSLYDGHAPIVVSITSNSCGGINFGLNNTINCTEVYLGEGYLIGYRFKVTNLATGQVAYIDTIQHHFKLTDTNIYAYGTTYAIQVAAIVNGEVQPFNGPTCTLTTTSVATTKVVPAQCGSTLLFMNSTINATAINSAITYRFRVARADAPTVYYYTGERNLPNFNLTMLTAPTGFLTYATEYKVDVQIKIKLANLIAWSQFGQVCSIFTPQPPTTAVIASQCEMTASSNTQVINATPFAGATVYRFLLTHYDSFGNLDYQQYQDSPTPSFTLSMFTGLLPGTTYTVAVSMQLYGTFVPYDKDCSITTPLSARMAAVRFEAKAYPNPYEANFMIDVKSSSTSDVTLKVYDMVGRLVEQKTVKVNDLDQSPIGERYPSGVYNIVVTQGEEVQTVRVVKR